MLRKAASACWRAVRAVGLVPPPPVPDQLRDRSQTTLGTAYTPERERGGGELSRDFLIHDEALGRGVAFEVLAPVLARTRTSRTLWRPTGPLADR